jgi:predicted small secreted protein
MPVQSVEAGELVREDPIMFRLCAIFLIAVGVVACSTVGNGIESGGNWITNTAERMKNR